MTNEVQTKKEVATVDAYLFVEKIKESWNLVLPSVCTPDRFARVALSCIRKDDKLVKAIQTKEGQISVAQAFMQCAELGIEPDGRRAYLIPYKDNKSGEYTINLIIDYKGIAELAMRSGYISNIHADKVCDKDDFVYNMGSIEKHIIDFKQERGEAYAYYAVVTFKDGSKKCEVMSKNEIDKIKERSSAWSAYLKYKKLCPWNTDYDEMAKKTVFKRLAKWIPQSPEMQKAIEIDDADYKKDAVVIDSISTSPEDYEALPLDKPVGAENAQTPKVEENPVEEDYIDDSKWKLESEVEDETN